MVQCLRIISSSCAGSGSIRLDMKAIFSCDRLPVFLCSNVRSTIAIERAPGKPSSRGVSGATRIVRCSRRPCPSSVVQCGSDQSSGGVSSMAFLRFGRLSLTGRT